MNLLYDISTYNTSKYDVIGDASPTSHEHKHEHSNTENDKNYFLKPIPRIRHTQNESHYSDYEQRRSAFEEKRRFRRNTVSQLREETEQKKKISYTHLKGSITAYNIPDIQVNDKINNNKWQKYLQSMHNDLSERVQYFQLIDKEIPSVWNVSDIDIHIMERTLIQQMKYWIQRYGVPAMVAHQEVYKLKKDLISAIEEADTLEEESVQLTQNMFEMENEIQILKNEQHKLYQKINGLNGDIYKMKQKYEYKNGYNIPPPPPIINPPPPPPPPLTSTMIKELLLMQNENDPSECIVTQKQSEKETIVHNRRPQLKRVTSVPVSNNTHTLKQILLFACYK